MTREGQRSVTQTSADAPAAAALSTERIQEMVDACHAAGGGRVTIPPGEHVVGPLRLLDNVNLHLEAGAVLKGSPDVEDYPREYTEECDSIRCLAQHWDEFRAGLITARGAKHVSITGQGVIDGNAAVFYRDERMVFNPKYNQYTRQGEAYMKPEYPEDAPRLYHERPGGLIRFHDCEQVLIDGVTIQNSPNWTVTFRRSADIRITGVTIDSWWAGDYGIPNDDGINVTGCRDMVIADSVIRTGDDCLAITGMDRLMVSNCSLSGRLDAIRLGYVNTEPTRDCVFTNLTIHASNRGVGLFVNGEGSIENVSFDNITMRTRIYWGPWWGKGEPIHISAVPYDPDSETLGTIKGVRFSNILAESDNGILIHGWDDSVIEDVTLDNVRLRVVNSHLHEACGGNFDLQRGGVEFEVPHKTPDEVQTFAHDIPAVYARHVEGLRIRDLDVSWEDGLPEYFTHAVQCEDFTDVIVDGLRGRQAHVAADHAVIRLDNGSGAFVRNCVPTAGAKVLLTHDGVDRVLEAGNGPVGDGPGAG